MIRTRWFTIDKWIEKSPYFSAPSGLWPHRLWPYIYREAASRALVFGIGYHGGTVADAHLRLIWW